MDERSDAEIEAHLRQGAGREWLEEVAEDEQLTELMRRRRLGLGDRARELVHRGQRARAEIGSHTFSGPVVYAGSDFATVDRGEDVVEVVLDAAVWTVERGESGGQEQSGEPLSFQARLAEVAAATAPVRVIADDGRVIMGSVELVTADHVEMAQDGNTIVIPTRLIVALIRPNARF
jgi:hypothetical protein